MTQLDVVKAFLNDETIQAKYNLTLDDVTQLTMTTQFNGEANTFVNLVRQLVSVTDDSGALVTTAAQRLNAHLETALR